jgi:two-component system chemotaxis sensor kinase CheA
VSFFSDERAAELRELFFESALEHLQAMNDAGLELEAHPGDEECVRRVRRAVHTLKGDSAACGFRELSELAHELEDMLTPQHLESRSAALAEVVLTAADTFHAMLAAYHGNLQPPAGDALRKHMRRLLEAPDAAGPAEIAARFDWNAEERGRIAEAAQGGKSVYHIALSIDPESQMRAAALQLARMALESCGTILALRPEEGGAAEDVRLIEAALSSAQSKDWIARKCRIPAVVTAIIIEQAGTTPAPSQDLLDLLLESEAQASGASKSGAAWSGETKEEEIPDGRTAPARAAEKTLRVEAGRIDAVLSLVGELIMGKSMLQRSIQEFERRFPKDALCTKLADGLAFQARVLDELQKSVMKIRMVPVEQFFRRVPRIVRDVARKRGREVTLQIVGQNTGLDKGILDELAEPLTHLVRNAVDHGIESREERLAAGKPERGSLRLNAFQKGSQVVIEISDDGRGIDREKLVRRAIEQEFLTAEGAERLSDAEAFNLVFLPGLSTADAVTEVSGRGIGMDVVHTVLERLKGEVRVQSARGKGTTIQLMVPLTLASIPALLFRVAGRPYAIPLASVLEITRATAADVHRVENREVIQLRNQTLPLLRLDQQASGRAPGQRFVVVVVMAVERKFGFVVDSMIGEEDLVVKALDQQLAAVDLFSGASILGDGTVVLVLNVSAFIGRMARPAMAGALA